MIDDTDQIAALLRDQHTSIAFGFHGATSVEWDRLILSVQHLPKLPYERQHRILLPILKHILGELENRGPQGTASTFTSDKLILNGAGEFAIGGPVGDNGLSGKKLVIAHYGPGVPIGGGALCGKDPHKVDKCGALRARQLAKELVRNQVTRELEIGRYCSLRTTVRGRQSTQGDIAVFIYHDPAANLSGSGLVVVSFDTGGELAEQFADAWFEKTDALVRNGLSKKENN